MVDILLTNDDGYKSVGFLALLKELSKQFSVVAVAPSEEKSWIGKSITKGQALECKKAAWGGFDVFAISGTPADCVQIGLYGILEEKPKIVTSGINTGENVGHARILSSGTLGAAMEASIDGVMSLASSLYIPPDIKKVTDFFDIKNCQMFRNAAKITVKLIKILMKNELGNGVDLISINMPFEATADSDFEVTVPFREPYGRLFHEKGGKFMHANPTLGFNNLKEGTDLKALSEGKVSITPVSLELVSRDSLEYVKRVIRKEW